MNAERWEQVQTLFKEIITLEGPTREHRLRQVQDTDPDLYKELCTLLAADADDRSILEGYALDRIDLSELFTSVGSRVGPFKLVEKIGEGGMGAVYEARRIEGGFDQRVALKLIRWAIGSEQKLDHFERERRILALLEHPNISRLIDGGLTPWGQPWFAMEFVEGVPIDEYCSRRQLSDRQILTLFRSVLSAVQFAHRNLVIHRDLKPANILVQAGNGEQEPTVKLLDFGIASITEENQQSEAIGMTLAYASPEQKSGSVTSTSSDLFSLGIILYELLSGVHPNPEYRRKETSPEKITPELAAICEKAMKKSPEDRFEAVAEMMTEIDRWMDAMPVHCYSRKRWYRVQKFLKRNAGSVSIASVATAAILLLVLFYTLQLQQQRQRAEREAERANRITEVLTRSFQAVDPFQNPDGELTARTLLDQSLNYIDTELQTNPQMQAHLGGILAEVYANLGMHEVADSLSAASFSTFAATADTQQVAYIEKLVQRSDVLLKTGQIEESGTYIKQAVELADKQLDPQTLAYADVYYQYNNYLYEVAAYERADSMLKRILPVYKSNRDKEPGGYLDVLFFLGTNYRQMGIYDSAEVYLLSALKQTKARYKSPDEKIASTLNHLSSLYQDMDRPEMALPYAEESYQQRLQIFGDSHINTIASQANFARALSAAGRWEEAAEKYRTLIKIFGEHYPQNHNIIGLQQSYASVLMNMEKFEAAENLLDESIRLSNKLLPENNFRKSYPLQTMASLLVEQEKYTEALKFAHSATSIRANSLGEENPLLASSRYTLGICQWHTGQKAEAEINLKKAMEIFAQRPEQYRDQISEIEELGI